jgi:hypothetical protein
MSKSVSHYVWGTNGVSDCEMNVKSTWIPTWHQMDHVSWSLGGRPNTKPEDHGTQNAQNCWFILFYHVWGPSWIEIHWHSIWLRAWSHMTSHYTWGSVATLYDFGGVLGRPLDTFFWALNISRSRLLARVWSGPKCMVCGFPKSSTSIYVAKIETRLPYNFHQNWRLWCYLIIAW